MSPLTLDQLLARLQAEDESLQIEAKRASRIDRSVLQTIVAFANEPGLGGGYLILGAEAVEAPLFPGIKEYRFLGLTNPDQLQADLATQCRDALTPPLRPDIRTEARDGRVFLIVHVPEAQPQEKPVHIAAQGLPKGAYRRIAATDQHCTEHDLELFFQGRAHITFDQTVIAGTSLDDVDPSALAAYRRDRARINPQASELTYSDEDLLQSLTATFFGKEGICLTMAGLMLFGKESAQRRHMPMARVDYIVVPGQEWVPDPEQRYQGVELRGPLLTLVPRALNAVLGDIKMVPSLRGSELNRTETPIVPATVLREAIVNAVMHRNYMTRSPIQIIRYSNRIEFRNPGYSLVSAEHFGEPGSISRNEKIAAVLHEVGLAETKGTGIRTMRRLMREAQLSPPTFESDRDRDAFLALLLLHHFLVEEDLVWLKQFEAFNLDDTDSLAVLYLREVGAIDNSAYRTLGSLDTLKASAKLRHLRDLGLLEQMEKGSATYYLPSGPLASALASGRPAGLSGMSPTLSGMSPALSGMSPALSGMSPALSGMSPALSGMSPALSGMSPVLSGMSASGRDLFAGLPGPLVAKVRGLGRRAKAEVLRGLVLELCACRDFDPQDLGNLLGKNYDYLRERILYPLIQEGLLLYRYPESPRNPKQAYRTAPGALKDRE